MKAKTKKLTRREKMLASETIAEEVRLRKFPTRQAVAIGLSRARRLAAHEHAMATACEYL